MDAPLMHESRLRFLEAPATCLMSSGPKAETSHPENPFRQFDKFGSGACLAVDCALAGSWDATVRISAKRVRTLPFSLTFKRISSTGSPVVTKTARSIDTCHRLPAYSDKEKAELLLLQCSFLRESFALWDKKDGSMPKFKQDVLWKADINTQLGEPAWLY
jgi:hypothetical protein